MTTQQAKAAGLKQLTGTYLTPRESGRCALAVIGLPAQQVEVVEVEVKGGVQLWRKPPAQKKLKAETAWTRLFHKTRSGQPT